MKKVIKLLIVLLTVCLTAFAVTACGGNGDNGGSGDNGGNGGGHTHDYSFKVDVVNPTCQNEGYSKRTCSCGAFITDTYLPSTVHALDADRNCTTCDKKASVGLRIVDNELRSLSTCTDTEIIVPIGVTSIYNGAFKNKTKITAIYIPKTVTEIKKDAFLGCSSLKKVIFEDESQIATIGTDVFKDCGAIEYLEIEGGLYLGTATKPIVFIGLKDKNAKSISVADGTKILYQRALYNLSALEEVSLPNSIVSMGENVFYSSNSIKKSTYRGTANEWASINFCDSYSTPAYYSRQLDLDGLVDGTLTLSVDTIKNYAFNSCLNVKNLVLENNVKTIEICAFTNCSEIRTIKIGSGLEFVDEKAFENCVKAFEVINDSSLVLTAGSDKNGNIANYARNLFKSGSGSSKYTQNGDFLYFPIGGKSAVVDYLGENPIVSFPTDTTVVGPYALYNRTFVTEVIIPEGIKEIGDYACYGLKQLTQLTFPDSLQKIGNHTFEGCSKVTALNFSDKRNLTNIGDYAFAGLSSIETVILPDGLKRTGHFSFENCTSLTKFSMPSSIEELAYRIMNGCKLLKDITFRGANFFNDKGRSLHELAINTFYDNGVSQISYYFWWYYECGTAKVKYPLANGLGEGVYDFEQKGR